MVRAARHVRKVPVAQRIPYPGVYQHVYPTRRNCPAHYRVRFIVPVRLYRDNLLPAPKGVEEYYDRARRNIYLGCYTEPEVAFTALLMFLLNFVVEFPWTAPDVLTYLRSLDYAASRVPDLEHIRTAHDMYVYACLEVYDMFPITDDGSPSADEVTRDLEQAVGVGTSAVVDPSTGDEATTESDDMYLDYLDLEPYVLDRAL